MKRLLLLIPIFFLTSAFEPLPDKLPQENVQLARMNIITVGGGVPEITEDSCTGGLELSWHMENLELDNEPGCSNIGNHTWVEHDSGSYLSLTTADKSDYLQSMFLNAHANDWYEIAATQNTSATEGKIVFDIMISGWVTGKRIIAMEDVDSTDLIILYMTGSDSTNIDISTWIETGNDYHTADCNIDQGSWYRITYQWDVTKASNADQVIKVETLDASIPRQVTGTVGTYTDTDGDALTLTAAIDDFKIGIQAGSGTPSYYVDNFKYYSESGL